MAIRFDSIYITATGLFMPGPAVGNDSLDRYIAPLGPASARIKTRYYAIDENGETLHSSSAMAAAAVTECLAASEIQVDDLTMLFTGSSDGDLAMPGLANMDLPGQAFRLLTYHGETDVEHLDRWLNAVESALSIDPSRAGDIVAVAKATASLYLLQMEHAA